MLIRAGYRLVGRQFIPYRYFDFAGGEMSHIFDIRYVLPEKLIILRLAGNGIDYFKSMRGRRVGRSIIFLTVLLSCSNVYSQTLLSSTGNTIQNNTISVEYTIGEIGISTLAGNQSYATQGFLQPIFKFKDCSLLEFIPNAFTPNKDNINDCFGVKNWPATSSYELTIYNRWGQLVFKTTNASECWNGDFQGQPQSTGTYVYIIKANTSLCGQITKKGTVTLIR